MYIAYLLSLLFRISLGLLSILPTHMKCYRSDEDLTDANRSKEHIIPNFLGGKLTSRDLLCKQCNSKLGETLDAEMESQLGFAADIVVNKRHREKKVRQVELETIAGRKMMVGKHLNPKDKLYIRLPHSGKVIELTADSRKDLIRLAERKKKELSNKYGSEFKYTEHTEHPTTEKGHFKNKVSSKVGEIGFGGIVYLRGIGKIMLNFYLSQLTNAPSPVRLLDFVNGKSNKNIVFAYHPDYDIHKLTDYEFSHIIHIRGEKDMGAIYAYVELFNFENYICIIDDEYKGDDFEVTYCYDCIANKQIKKSVFIDLKRHHLEILNLISLGHRKRRQTIFNQFEKRVEKLQDL